MKKSKPMIDLRALGAAVKAEREKKEITQESLAKRVGYKIGVIQKLEQGKYLSWRTCLKQCEQALKIEIGSIIAFVDSMPSVTSARDGSINVQDIVGGTITSDCMKPVQLHHINLPVSDLKRSSTFYQQILMLEVIERPNFGFEGEWLKMPSGQRLHLVLHPNGTYRKGGMVDPRDSHFAIQVEDFARAVAFISINIDASRWKLDPYKMNRSQLYLLDPDDHVVEINAL